MSDKRLSLLPFGRKVEITANALCGSSLVEKILSEKKAAYSFKAEGYTSKSPEALLLALREQKLNVLFEDFRKSEVSYLLGLEDGDETFLELYVNQVMTDLYVEVVLLTDNKLIFENIKRLFNDLESLKKESGGYVFSIIRNIKGELQFIRLGVAGIPLERKNYDEATIKAYDYVVKGLKSKTPSGRIVILEGVPGGGKTYLTRSLLMDVDNGMFIIVPPNMVSSLGGPDLLPLLLKQKESYGALEPMILVLEDADECLLPRAGDNMSTISSLLNLGDGILGSLLDIRIIATTNAKQDKMDPAILRAERLLKRIEIKPLGLDKAQAIFSRLTKSTKEIPPPPKPHKGGMHPISRPEYTLAEIYAVAREHGWEPSALPVENAHTSK